MNDPSNRPLYEIPDLPGITPSSPELERRVKAALTRERGPTRSVVMRQRNIALVGTIAWAVVHLNALGPRADLPDLPPWYVASWCIAPAALCGVALWVAVRMQRSALGVRATMAMALSLALPATLMVFALGLPMPHLKGPTVDLWSSTLRCFELTFVGALPPLLFAAIALRRAFATAARYRGALVGSACGLLSGLVMNLHCPVLDPMHLLVGHVIPVLASVLLGAWVGYRWLRP